MKKTECRLLISDEERITENRGKNERYLYKIRNIIGKFSAKIDVLKSNYRNSLVRQIRLQENSTEYTETFCKANLRKQKHLLKQNMF